MKKPNPKDIPSRLLRQGNPAEQIASLQKFFPGTGTTVKTGKASGYKPNPVTHAPG